MHLHNFSFKDYPDLVAHMVGHGKRYGHPVALLVTLFYCCSMLVGIAGNAITCLIVKVNSYMQTSSNYYLVNLAVVDLITLVLGKDATQINAIELNDKTY